MGLSLGILYNDRDTRLSVIEVSDALDHCHEAVTREHSCCDFQLEMGRYLVGEAGLFITRVVDVKSGRGETFVVCDGGINHFLAASGNLGQVIPRNYPMCFSPRRSDSEDLQVVGLPCSPLDRPAKNSKTSAPVGGDLLCVAQAGASGASASPQGFLSRGSVSETLV